MRKRFSLLLLLAVVLILPVVTACILKVHVPVGGLVKVVVGLVNTTTERQVNLIGHYYVVPGVWLQLICENGEIFVEEPQGTNITATIARASTLIHLPSLFKRQVLLDHVAVNGISVDLETGTRHDIPAKKETHGVALEPFPHILRQIGDVDGRDVRLTIRHAPDSEPFVFMADSIVGYIGEMQPGELKVAGHIQSHSFEMELGLDPLENITHPGTAFNYLADIRYDSAHLALNGKLSNIQNGYQIDSDFDLNNFTFSSIISSVVDHTQEEALLSCAGEFTLSPGKMKIDGDSSFSGTENLSFSIVVENSDSGNPVVISSITADLIDLDTLMSFKGEEKGQNLSEGTQSENPRNYKEILIFPHFLSDKNLDLNLNIQKIIVAGREITGLNSRTLMIDGMITDAPFSAALQQVSFQGQYSLDAASEPPRFQMQYTTNFWDLGVSLTESGFAEGVELTVAKTGCTFKTSGRKLNDLISTLDFTINASDGLMKLQDYNTDAELPVEIDSLTITGKPGEKIALKLGGRLDKKEVRVSASIEDKRGVALDKIDSIPFQMTVEGEETEIKLEGMFPLPFRFVGASMTYRLEGSDIKTLQDITHVEIPVTGSYHATGTLHLVPAGYQIENLELAIGESVLQGKLELNTKVLPPKIIVELHAEKVQLADLDKEIIASQRAIEKEKQPEITRKEQKPFSGGAVPEKLDAEVRFQVDNIFSGNDYIGSGSIHFELSGGKFIFKPVHITLPAGEMDAEFSMEPLENDRLYRLKIDIDELDYGILSRWFKPTTDQEGIFNLRSVLTTRVSGNNAFLVDATGYIDFCLQPENFRTGIIDLWAVNLVSYLIPIFMPTSDSQLNCIAGRFNIDDGKMKAEDLLVDTSRIQVKGSMDVDFSRRWIDSRLRPIPKRPQFYSLSTPLQISGKLDDLRVGVARGGVVGTMIRVLTSYVVVPLQWAVLTKIPVDATEQCYQMYNQRGY